MDGGKPDLIWSDGDWQSYNNYTHLFVTKDVIISDAKTV